MDNVVGDRSNCKSSQSAKVGDLTYSAVPEDRYSSCCSLPCGYGFGLLASKPGFPQEVEAIEFPASWIRAARPQIKPSGVALGRPHLIWRNASGLDAI